MNWNFDEKHLEIAKVLVEEIKNRNIITYKELGMNVRLSVEPQSDLYSYLGDLSYYSFENGMPLISVIVVRKEEKIPGEGFYKEVYEKKRKIKVGKNKQKQMDVFVEELNRVFEYSNWNKLIELLEKEIFQTTKSISRIKKKRTMLLRQLDIDKTKDKEIEFIEVDEFTDIEDIAIEEGKYIEKLMKSKKRNPKARKIKIEQFKKDNDGNVFCEVCKEDDEVALDVHHDNVEICNMEDGHLTKLTDLRVLCANCHRKVHGYKITVEELIKRS